MFKSILIALFLFSSAVAQVPDKVMEVSKSVVRVRVSEPKLMRTGSGVYIGNGFILTAKHVVESKGKITILTEDKEVDGTLVLQSETHDQAVIKADINLPPIAIANSGNHLGKKVYGIGYALGERKRIWETQVTELWFRSTGTEDPDNIAAELGSTGGSITGCSGGPLLNKDGEIIGVVWGNDGGGLLDGKGRTIATSLPILRRFIHGVK